MASRRLQLGSIAVDGTVSALVVSDVATIPSTKLLLQYYTNTT